MNDKVRNMKVSILSDNWYTLNKVDFEYLNNQNTWEHQSREAYDRGNGAVVLLYNPDQKTVILTRQFRMPTYLNKNSDGMMIEACAGLLDENDPKTAIIKEIEEETGYRIKTVEKVFESYMSPGSVTEILHFFIAAYSESQKVSEGGGAADETENIEVLEYSFQDALALIKTGEIKDAKTIMLLQYAQINLADLMK
ncbi:NUDIX domain-containing protein [Leeuwenhoekiella palythoae]|uniref:NUDIX domain-containing protein n=1 Tax=Leeuwenhoekiella palythoae TaxID=573501 RepID=UPI000C5A9AFE|nr:NUDIX domain-containing protein [Leeuwenhoekiella palythoae]MBH13144.1 GDP-mannose pyrophosphatase [Leeuwenhoekiella sp.]UBZ12109.1 NUDIX domain-containing protein [Leeuwenhoekiella palythoae]HAX16177.1 GDP-mannose pyrophosphatase [Leeuwenhoekiella sp.]HBO29163.1 GDP-mannose pyrophosphatase [Leeuwenhoekiella sp.]|tara:strand:+ start:151 stop:738 length:588 start_codon:yes stop_codon:yes gene_type:complete